ncbi:MAG: glycoside hydrolase family 3 C-terminal domain-containing protein, partial [Clostridia bacterium]|nr:glycoside hydrolase family 3 C-terminal domain-containing protein [Clostridia bacterium]
MKTRTKNRAGLSLLIAVLAVTLGVSAIRINRTTAYAADGPGNYQSDYANEDAALNAAVDLNNQIAEESFVLLKNEDNVLPVPTTSNVVVMGHGAEDRIAGGSGSGATGTNSRQPATTIVQGLRNAGFSSVTSVFTNSSNGGWSTNVTASATGSSAPQSTQARLNTVQGGDIVFVVISRTSGENVFNSNNATYSDQAVTGIASDHGHILELDNNEKQLLKIANDNNQNVVLVINAPNALALDELKDPAYPNVKGAIWVGGVGNDGYNALGRLVSGQANPSAHLPDSYVVDLTKDPTWFNWGTNAHIQGAASFQYRVGTSNSGRYGQYYEEGIYLGYRYYETRAHEYDPAKPITRIGEVAYANGEEWYRNTVMYPFGYGLSYTTFDWEILSGQTTSAEVPLTASSEIAIQVKVTNTGSYAGKDVVQLYYTAPYTKGGIEKSYKVLGDFEKTKLIQPGKSDVVTLHINLKDMASYDYSDKNNNSFKGYESEAGEYVMHISTDSHNVKTDKNGEKLDLTYVLEEDVLFATDEATGTPVVNRFDDISDDFNLRATEFSRADMVGTFPVAPTTAEMTIDANYQELLNNNSWNYNTSFNAAASSTNVNAKRFSDNLPTTPWYIGGTSAKMPTYGATPSRTIMLHQLVGRPYEDRRWDSFMEQLTINEMYNLIRQGGYQTTAISRLGVPQTSNQDGPQTLNRGVTYVAPVNIAATWNKELCYDQGRAIGNEGLWRNVEGWYAPAVNTHRSAFGGRNFEYYSECGVLAGKIAAEVVRGCTDKGLIVTVKHFA